MEQMRRVSPKFTSNFNNKLNTSAMFSKAGDRKSNSAGTSKKPQNLPNHLQMLVPKAIQNKPAKETVSTPFLMYFLFYFSVLKETELVVLIKYFWLVLLDINYL